ncbi:MAG: energy-coupling factor transporter transmembrane protein EcfT [Clostridiales bacterium]|nr:energy-coupling factor transporter transmembrane protein EcfT [Clostridiales bacterium]
MQGFASYHPAVLFFTFLAAAVLTMFTQHPALLLLSLAGALGLFMIVKGPAAACKGLAFRLPFPLALALINPLFNRQGELILFRLGGLPVTLESLLYGLSVGLMLTDVTLWFASFSRIVTADKTLYLLGRPFPRLALILSSAMRFVPLFSKQARAIHQAQKTMGMYAGSSRRERLRAGMRSFTALLVWSLENAVDTADAMEARGYGLSGGTRPAGQKLHSRDITALLTAAALFIVGAAGIWGQDALKFTYFPRFVYGRFSAGGCIVYVCCGLLFFLPCLMEAKEHMRWIRLQSKI